MLADVAGSPHGNVGGAIAPGMALDTDLRNGLYPQAFFQLLQDPKNPRLLLAVRPSKPVWAIMLG